MKPRSYQYIPASAASRYGNYEIGRGNRKIAVFYDKAKTLGIEQVLVIAKK